MTWEKTLSVEKLQAKPGLFKSNRKQIALFLVDGQPYAIDNRCPHEGYPLVEGKVGSDCVLTCNWHNWKFRLNDGECLLGGDHVRSYPARVEDGYVWVDTTPPPPEEIQEGILRGLRTAFGERDYGRICREIARLHYNGLDPLEAVRMAIQWSHDRLELGFTHAYAASADWLAQAARLGADFFEKRLVCLSEAVDHIAFDALREPQYPYAQPGEPFQLEAFLQAVEAEEYERVEGMVIAGLRDGLHWADMEPALVQSALDHYNDFGHSLIYVQKSAQLLQLAGNALERYLLPPLARHLCYATREDLIPEFKSYRPILDTLPPLPGREPLPGHDEPPLRANIESACRWVAERFARHDPLELYDCLLAACAYNLLHFDMSYQFVFDRSVSDNVGWLDFTHGITFGNAVRELCSQYPHLWRAGLLQMACFVGRNRPYMKDVMNESLWEVADESAFFAEADDLLLDHGMRDPIFSAHLLKTTVAVREELAHAGTDCHRYLLASLNRFLHSPIKQKHARRLAKQAISLVMRDFE